MKIQVSRLTKRYGRARPPVLVDIDFEIEAGETFGIIGPNGAGKSTLMSCLLGLVRPDSGSVLIGGRPPDDLERRAMTGYLPERLEFEKWMTGRQFISFQHALSGRSEMGRAREVEELLALVGLDHRAWTIPLRKYSLGMLRRLGLAQALIGSPQCLFLDEPASGLDPPGCLALLTILGGLRARGVTVVVNSHQLDHLERICDRVAYLDRGRVAIIEDLRQRQPCAGVLRVRWIADGSTLSGSALASLACGVGAGFLEAQANGGRFTVSEDAQAAALLRELVKSGVAVAEATLEGRRLEALFGNVPDERQR